MTSRNDEQHESAGPLAGSEPTLRQRAEDQLAGLAPQDLAALSPEEVRRLLHELRVHQIELEMQNEELRRTREEVEASQARYFDLYDLAPVGYLTVSEKGLILEANLTAATLLAVARSALVKQPLTHFVLPEDQDIYYRHRKQLFDTGELQVCELRLLRAESPFWARLEASVGRGEGGGRECRVVLSDIRRRKQAEEQSEKLYEQTRRDAATKATLLQEVHHRVKNNLQIISSMLNLQADQAEDAQVSRALENSQHRVRAIALVHESLYQTPDLAHLDLGRYVEELVGYLIHAYASPATAIAPHMQVEAVPLDLNQGVPCGLILTELVTNALKHAFNGRQTGEIWITLRERGASAALGVRDDGVGLPAGLDPFHTPSLGLRIVQLLTRQVRGTLAVDSTPDRGTAITLTFPLAKETR